MIYKHPNCNIALNRKTLSELAATEPFAFKSVVDVVQESTGVHKEHAIYSHEDGWEFDDDGEDPDDYDYDFELEEWVPKKDMQDGQD